MSVSGLFRGRSEPSWTPTSPPAPAQRSRHDTPGHWFLDVTNELAERPDGATARSRQSLPVGDPQFCARSLSGTPVSIRVVDSLVVLPNSRFGTKRLSVRHCACHG